MIEAAAVRTRQETAAQIAGAQARTEAMMETFFAQISPLIKAASDVTSAGTKKSSRARATPPPGAAPGAPDFTQVHPRKSSSSAADTRAAEDESVVRMLHAHKLKQVQEANEGFAQQGEEEKLFRPLPSVPRPSASTVDPLRPRPLAPDPSERLRGGEQRRPTREACLDRLQNDSGNITLDELEMIKKVLGIGHQVQRPPQPVSSAFCSPPGSFSSPPIHPLSNLGMGGAMRGAQAAPELFRRLQENGLAPAGLGEEALLAAHKMYKLEGQKASKQAAKVNSFSDFVEFFRKAQVCTRDMHEAHPDSFWAMHWHFQSVTHLHANYGWTVASKYHTSIMKQWQEGRLHPASYTETEECRSGDIEGSLHLRNFILATCGKGEAYKQSTDGGNGLGTGSYTQEAPDWTYCAFEDCKCYFPPSSNHSTASCRKKKAKAKRTRQAASKKKDGKPDP